MPRAVKNRTKWARRRWRPPNNGSASADAWEWPALLQDDVRRLAGRLMAPRRSSDGWPRSRRTQCRRLRGKLSPKALSPNVTMEHHLSK